MLSMQVQCADSDVNIWDPKKSETELQLPNALESESSRKEI